MAPALRRVAVIGVCICLLGGLFVLAGAGYPTPPSPTSDLADPDTTPDDLAGEHVETGGEIIATDPVIIKIDGDTGTQRLPIENAPTVEVGQDVIVNGTITEDGRLDARPDRAVVREPWETTYMYAVSALAGLLVAARGIDGWGVNLRTLSVYPRAVPLHEQLKTAWRNHG